jgi:ribosome-binding protein aMBF1 (putative translation factor)
MREARLNCGLSQGNIAEMLHCDQTTISRMEQWTNLAPDCAQIRILSSTFSACLFCTSSVMPTLLWFPQ